MSMSRTYIIAEAGVNHNGSLEMAKKLIDVAVDAGADAVKFQTFKAEKIISRLAPKAEYQKRTTNSAESQLEMVKRLELDKSAHLSLIEYCGVRNISFLSTPFDLESVDLLVGVFGLPRIKVSSGDITNAPLLLKAASLGASVILSTGMSTLGEVETALSILAFGYNRTIDKPSLTAFREAYCSESGQQALKKNVVLLHCTTEYPAPFEDVNLRAIDTLGAAFGLPVGYSDHTNGISVPIAAVARGAVVIEKHFTLDRNLLGPDHNASLEPEDLKTMIKSIRQIERALGSSLKMQTPSEQKNMLIARKSIMAGRVVKKGEKFTMENLTVKRPGNGISPLYFWELLGRVSDRDYEEDEMIIL